MKLEPEIMTNNILKTINKIFGILSHNDKLVFKNSDLFNFSDTEIITPIGNILPLLLKHKSKLSNQPIKFKLLEQLINELTKNKSIIRLNHIGFCYKVASQEQEKQRLVNLVKQTRFHLYQEKSNDDALWLFIGNLENWEKPLIEMVPVVKTNDKWVNYWLPHIQIDIDTTLTSQEIEDLITTVYNKTIKPYLFTIDGIVYFVRNRLGCVDRININLDLATNSRNTKFHRQHSLTKIS